MKKLQYGMDGGEPGSFISDAHRKAIGLDRKAQLAAGCFSRKLEKSQFTADQLGIDRDRVYSDCEEMAVAEAAKSMIKQGLIGEIRTIMREYPQGWLAQEDITGNKQGEWRIDPAQSGKTKGVLRS